MRVFVTGATGFIGSAVIQELLGAGHSVLGLARSDKSAEKLTRLGAQVQRGSLEDLASLREGAAASEGVIHLGFVHELSQASAAQIDIRAIEAIGSQLAGTNRPFVGVLGTMSLRSGKLGTEKDALDPSSVGGVRSRSEKAVFALASKGVRAMVVGLPPTVHGDGDRAFVPFMIETAKKHGVSAFINDGLNRWPAVHQLDAARLLRFVLEKGVAQKRYHAVADEGILVKDIATVIGRKLNIPVQGKTNRDAARHFGWLSAFLSADNPVSSRWTQERLGWRPTHPGLMADLESGTYF